MKDVPVVGIHGVPRSGTSWLGQLFNSHERVAYRYQPFFSYAFRGRVDAGSDGADFERFFFDLMNSDDDFVLQRGESRLAAQEPVFTKSGNELLVYKEVRFHDLLPRLLAEFPNFKGIGIVRDPRAVLASWANAPREFDKEWSFEDEWRSAASKNEGLAENWYGFNRWKELTGLFLELERQFPSRFLIVRYEDLVADTEAVLKRAFDHAEIQIGDQTASFVLGSTSIDDGDPYGVYRRNDSRREEMAKIDPLISSTIEVELVKNGLDRFLA